MREQNGTTLNTDYGYTHQRSDAVSGLGGYGARYYDPVAGQFISADTTLAGGLNRYAYVGGMSYAACAARLELRGLRDLRAPAPICVRQALVVDARRSSSRTPCRQGVQIVLAQRTTSDR